MKVDFSQNMILLSSMIDSSARVGLINALSLAQDNMCQFFKEIKCDGLTMVPTHNCFFVLSKTKLHFLSYPKWLEKITLRTYAVSMSKLRLTLKNELLDSTGKPFAEVYQEMCPIDATTRRPRLINTTNMPADFECVANESVDFEKFDIMVDGSNPAEKATVRPTSIDFYHHVNNVEYARIMLSVMDENFFYENDITDFEIHYISECRCGQEIEIYKKSVDENSLYFEIRRDGNAVCKALMKFSASNSVDRKSKILQG